jgi:hypothetical protein
VPDWLAIVIGLALLGLVWSDRRGIGRAWRRPARFWSRDADEAFRSRAPSQPLNVVLGVTLGVAAIVYGVIGLIT